MNDKKLGEFIRDICKVTPMSKSEAKSRLDLIIHQAEQSLNDMINEKVADERDKAEKHYEKEQDDYSQGYFMAMNTVMRYLTSLDKLTDNIDI